MFYAKKGFTLIELLIVIAIISILALIAIPNFLEAQTRSKVTREIADLRTQALALECYYVDWNNYPRDSDSSLELQYLPTQDPLNISGPTFGKVANGAICLTTPVAYMSGLLKDPFVTTVQQGMGAIGYRIASGGWSYGLPTPNATDDQGSSLIFSQVGPRPCFALIGVGPDGLRARCDYKSFPFMAKGGSDANEYKGGSGPSDKLCSNGQPMCWVDYDPTNGTVSTGDILRLGGDGGTSGRWMRNGAVVGADAAPTGCTACW